MADSPLKEYSDSLKKMKLEDFDPEFFCSNLYNEVQALLQLKNANEPSRVRQHEIIEQMFNLSMNIQCHYEKISRQNDLLK